MRASRSKRRRKIASWASSRLISLTATGSPSGPTRQVDAAHPALAQHRLDLVRADHLTDKPVGRRRVWAVTRSSFERKPSVAGREAITGTGDGASLPLVHSRCGAPAENHRCRPPDRGRSGRGRHGHGLPGHAAVPRPHGRAEVPATRAERRSPVPGALPAGGPDSGRDQPPPHRAPCTRQARPSRGSTSPCASSRVPTLKDEIRAGELDAARSVRLLAQVAEALDAAHAVGLIHRDVKPQNILIGEGDHAYLADFGLTKSGDGEVLTEAGQLIGTIDYISPEQARALPATTASDVYSLACVFYECLTGEVPVRSGERAGGPLRPHDRPAAAPVRASPRPARRVGRGDPVRPGKGRVDRPALAGDLIRAAERALGAQPSSTEG